LAYGLELTTNREYRTYDLIQELAARNLFHEIGRRSTAPALFTQSISDHIEAMHSRNGFSRDRMSIESTQEFDELYSRLLRRHCPAERYFVVVYTVQNLRYLQLEGLCVSVR
jgi:hypothetical protein